MVGCTFMMDLASMIVCPTLTDKAEDPSLQHRDTHMVKYTGTTSRPHPSKAPTCLSGQVRYKAWLMTALNLPRPALHMAVSLACVRLKLKLTFQGVCSYLR